MITEQDPAPEQSPDQLVNVQSALAVWVTVTCVPKEYVPAPLTEPPLEGLASVVSVNCRVKLAVTPFAELMVTEQDPAPEQSPDQLVKTVLAPGAAVRVTTVFLSNCALQVDPQLIPAGELVTVPEPLLMTVRVSCPVKLAETVLAALMVTEQEPVPEQPDPFHPLNTELAPGVAVSVTTVLVANCPLQLEPQLIPAGELVTVPEPPLVTVRVGSWAKLAVTLLSLSMVTVHEPMPEQSPDQPVNVQPALAVWVTVTWVPEEYVPAPETEPPLEGLAAVVKVNC
jgi:hypothetical protein